MKTMKKTQQNLQSKMFYNLSASILDILRSFPTPIDFSDDAPVDSSFVKLRRNWGLLQQITPAGVASFLLGISITLMFCGSVTFFIGFLLMPWILCLLIVFFVIGFVSSFSKLGRYFLSSSSSPANHCSSCKLL